MLEESPGAYATILIMQNQKTGLWEIWFQWEANGYGDSLHRGLERMPIKHDDDGVEYQERQWIQEQIRTINLSLINAFRLHKNIQFNPNAQLIY